MLEQKERARSSSNFNTIIPESLSIEGETDFLGYDTYSNSSKIVEIISYSDAGNKDELNEGEEGLIQIVAWHCRARNFIRPVLCSGSLVTYHMSIAT